MIAPSVAAPSTHTHTRITVALATLLATACAAAALAPAASAGVVTQEGDVLVLRASPGQSNLIAVNPEEELNGTLTGRISLRDPDGVTEWPAACERGEFGDGRDVSCTPQAGGVRLEGGDGMDTLSIDDDLPAGQQVVLQGGDGDDTLNGRMRGGAGRDTLDGGAGNDKLNGGKGSELLLGGAGNDELHGGAGTDELRAGDGDDLLAGDDNRDAMSPDVIDGGAGTDRVDDWTVANGGFQPPVTVSIDGVADDGRPGEGDDVVAVETIDLAVPVTLIAGADPVRFRVFNTSAPGSRFVGSPGPDVFQGFDYADTLDGAAGDDTIEGGYGDDVITPGPGRDTVNADAREGCNVLQCRAPVGNDTIHARDGEADSIDCGVGTDRAIVDQHDTIANCETVERAAVDPGGSGGPGGPDPGAGGGAGGRKTAVKAVVPKVRLGTALKKGLVVRVTGAEGRVSLKAKRAGRTVASGRATTKKGAASVRLRFTAKAKRSLGKTRKVTLRIEGSGVKRTVTLRR